MAVSESSVNVESPPCAIQIQEAIHAQVDHIIAWILTCRNITFLDFEKQLVVLVYEVGRLFISLFLCMREQYWHENNSNSENGCKQQGPKDRLIGTICGKVRYWRTYIYRIRDKGGYYPLDLELGIPPDGFSMLLRSYAAKIVTKMSYAQSVTVLAMFLQWAPSQRTIEEMVLGLGGHTEAWFDSAPVCLNDGEVLVIQIDSKATPTATEEELKKRRGKRVKNPHQRSQRHRSRQTRQQRGPKKRKKKGDKSKNGKMATIVVMYTLKRGPDGMLEGPINKKVYASYAPKRHAVAIARRDAEKRGFTEQGGKLIQIVTDGDNDLDRYIGEFFPNAEHTIDVFHVVEYLWKAGGCLYKEGSDELIDWVESMKEALYEGRASEIIEEIQRRITLLPKRGPGAKSRRQRLESIQDYLSKRLGKMNYKSLRDRDLEISSGAVEGAVNYVIAKRFDSGGMRWIKDRSEALLQLRCVEVNGDWDGFISFVHDKTNEQARQTQTNLFLKSKHPAALPTYGCTGTKQQKGLGR
jgi:hypothetical protein